MAEFDVYCDEAWPELLTSASPTADHLLIGSLWVDRSARDEFKREIRLLREKHGLHAEFKWRKISPARVDFYSDVVDFFLRSGADMRFRVIAIDRRRVDLSYHDSDAELGFYKFYYQLLHHWLVPTNRYRVFCDAKSNHLKSRIRTLALVLNRASRGSPVESIQAVHSDEVSLLQLADVLLGTVGARLNPRDLSPAKARIVGELEEGLGASLGPTSVSAQKLNVFRIRFGGAR